MSFWKILACGSSAVVMSLAFTAPAARANTPVSYVGSVVDEFRQPVLGVKVSLVGTPMSASTDAGGIFKMTGNAPPAATPGAAEVALEFTSPGREARTMRVDRTGTADLSIELRKLPAPGDPVEIGRFAYGYRKDIKVNPWETRWLSLSEDMLCGFLWESNVPVSHIEVEFPAGATPGKVKVIAAPVDNWFNGWDRSGASALPSSRSSAPGGKAATLTYSVKGQIGRVPVLADGGGSTAAVPVVRVYAQQGQSVMPWLAPQTVELEWGFEEGARNAPLAGSVEASWGAIESAEPLEEGNGLVLTGQGHWRETPTAAKRRGIRLVAHAPAGRQTAVSLRTSAGNCCFFLADLDRGPILIPRMGLYVVKQGGASARQFQQELAARNLKTVRQKMREAPEESYAAAMARVFGNKAKDLPAFPTPPYEPVMQIDVPEKALVDQWRLGAWHLKRWSRKVGEDKYEVSIWRFRVKSEAGPEPPQKRTEYEKIFRTGEVTCIGQESDRCIRVLDLLGLHDVARGGLNYWVFTDNPATAQEASVFQPGNLFKDFDGALFTKTLFHRGAYDIKHMAGHGQIMEVAALHHGLTDNQEWFLKAAPRLKKACEWILRQRKNWDSSVPRSAWCYGLQPPTSIGDWGSVAFYYAVNARYYAGLRAVAEAMRACQVGGANELLAAAESYRQDIRTAAERSAALTPVTRVSDGTYRRFVTTHPYSRLNQCTFHDPLIGFLCLADAEKGIYGVNEPLVQDVLDVIEDGLAGSGGISGQVGYERHPWLYLLSDEVPLFLRSLYRGYAALIRPWEWEGGPAAYEFNEHPGSDAWWVDKDKTHEEATFLERVRNMLVMEQGDQLWLARATPRAWLEQGKKISVKNAPTCFGVLSYEIVSDVDNDRISATVQLPSRQAPASVVLRLRHPKAAPIKSVRVNGKEWEEFAKDKEVIELKGLSGTASVVARY